MFMSKKIFKNNLANKKTNIQTDNIKECYLSIKQEIENSYVTFTNLVKPGDPDAVSQVCCFQINEYELYLDDKNEIGIKIMLYFALKIFCYKYRTKIYFVDTTVKEIINEKLLERNRAVFNLKDYELLLEDEKIIEKLLNEDANV